MFPSGWICGAPGSQRRLGRGERREHLVTGVDRGEGFARAGGGHGCHKCHGIPDVARLLAHCHQRGPVRHHVACVPRAGDVLPGCHHGNPRQRARGGHVQGDQLRPRMGRPQRSPVEHARLREVIHVPRLAADLRRGIHAGEPRPEPPGCRDWTPTARPCQGWRGRAGLRGIRGLDAEARPCQSVPITRSQQHCIDDLHVARAAAQVPAQAGPDLPLRLASGSCPAGPWPQSPCPGAVAALHGACLGERPLVALHLGPAIPSTVRTDFPSTLSSAVSAGGEKPPSTITEQAPHVPSPHPFFAAVSRASSRR